MRLFMRVLGGHGLLLIILSLSAQAKMTARHLEGKWCSSPTIVETLGAHRSMPNPTMDETLCIEFKVVRANAEGGIGRYIVTRSLRKGREYPLVRHPLERYDERKQVFEIESPGLFAFYTTRNGQIMINDQSLSRDLVTANGMIDADGKMKYLITFKPKTNQIDHASVSFAMFDKDTDRVDREFERRWDTLRDILEKRRTNRR